MIFVKAGLDRCQLTSHPQEFAPNGAAAPSKKAPPLNNLYNAYPTWLELTHRKLDQAILDACGWPHDLDD